MKKVLFLLFVILIPVLSSWAKGPQATELTPKLIKEKNLNWNIEVSEDDKGLLTFEIFIKLSDDEKKENIIARIQRVKDHNWALNALLQQETTREDHVLYKFDILKSDLSTYQFSYTTWYSNNSNDPIMYYLKLNKFYNSKI